ncbi:MAG: nucleotide pyrophosphohydrolase, partial [Betaproteobacteria bacterium]
IDLATPLPYPILTWEAVRDALAGSEDVTVRYWVRILTIALNHGYLSPPTTFGGNKDNTWTGKAILDAYAAGALGYTVVGRRGGLGGKEFTSDLVTGGWMRQRYEVAEDDSLAGQPNWFTVEEFVEAVRRRWLDVGGLQERLRAFAEERDWSAFHDPKNLSMALAAEVGELLEVFRWLTPAQSEALAHDPEKADESTAAREEIADTLILLLQLADALEVDLQSAVEAKIQLNAERYPASRFKGDATKYTRRRD